MHTDKAGLSLKNQKYPLYAEDCTEYFKSGEEAFGSILKDLRSAEKFIFMEYFIIGSGVMLDQILDILKEKVKHGVVVRIIYDDFGSINAIPPHFIKEMESIGIQTRRFNPYKPMLSVIMNDRDHRKILVIDGRVAHTGGYNIADEYINKKNQVWLLEGCRYPCGGRVCQTVSRRCSLRCGIISIRTMLCMMNI